MTNCDINSEDEKGGKSRSKSKSPMGTLKRRLSVKQKPKGKGSAPSGGLAEEDTFSSSAPVVFKDVRAQRPIRSTSLHSHHYSPVPWPLRPTNSEETCIKMEVRVKALVHSSSPSPALNGFRKDFCDLQAETVCQEQNGSLKRSDSPHGDLHLPLEEHVPVVIGLVPQDYIQYTVPLDEGMCPLERSHSYCLDTSSPMEVSAVPPQVGGSSFAENENQVDQDLVVAPEIFVDQSVNGLLIGTTGVRLQSSRASHDESLHSRHCYLQRNFSGLTGTDAHVAESMRCHLNFDPNSAPGVARVYASVQSSGPMVDKPY